MEIKINEELCIVCGGCISVCPVNPPVLRIKNNRLIVEFLEKCIGCLSCEKACPWEAIKILNFRKTVKE